MQAIAATLLVSLAAAHGPADDAHPVGPPPATFFDRVDEADRDAARVFYAKHLDAEGLPVVASAAVDDEALRRTREIVTHMLAGRPDVLRAMDDDGMYLVIIGRDQRYTDMPEYRRHPDPAYVNERVRGTGGKPTSFGEENVLSLPLDRYDDESIAVHEFAHTIDGTLGRLDPDWRGRLRATFRAAREADLYRDAYAASNPGEYWGEIVQAYFDCNRVNNWNHGHVGTREQLRAYDPAGYELVRSTLRLAPDQDWRYTWLRPLPNVGPPPARLKLDPYYTKFTFARELPVVGRGSSDEALLKANDTVRKLFAYRHDVLKGLIADGVKLVVLGPGESIADLPEYRDAAGLDRLARLVEYSPETRTLVVPEENVLGDPARPGVGPNQVVRVLALAARQWSRSRAVEPEEARRRRELQQYELCVEPLDERFDAELARIHEEATAAGRWKRTAAATDRADFWAAGVLAFFDAAGQDATPAGASHPVTSREALAAYDSALFELVRRTMAYTGKVDWRFEPGPVPPGTFRGR